MHEEKRRRLEAKGWQVGDAEEFLELTPEESTYIELKLRLADGLKQRRLSRRLTQVQVARLVRFLVEKGHYVTGQVIRIDGGRSLV